MSDVQVIAKILRLFTMKITSFEWRARGSELHLSLKP